MTEFEKWLLTLIVKSVETSCGNCSNNYPNKLCPRWEKKDATDEVCYNGIYQKFLEEGKR